jgi:chaperonin GroES
MKKISIKPLGNRVVVEPTSPEQVTASGIIIPDSATKEKPAQGTVIAVGPGEMKDGKMVTMGVKVGDKVLFSKYTPDEVEVDGKEYFIIREDSLLAILG